MGEGQESAHLRNARQLAADHGEEEGNSHQPHLRRGHRRPGGGGHQAVAAAQGGGEPRAAFADVRAHPARPWQEHPVRQLADWTGLLRRAAIGHVRHRGAVPRQRL